jgi:hypothetical protein
MLTLHAWHRSTGIFELRHRGRWISTRADMTSKLTPLLARKIMPLLLSQSLSDGVELITEITLCLCSLFHCRTVYVQSSC